MVLPKSHVTIIFSSTVVPEWYVCSVANRLVSLITCKNILQESMDQNACLNINVDSVLYASTMIQCYMCICNLIQRYDDINLSKEKIILFLNFYKIRFCLSFDLLKLFTTQIISSLFDVQMKHLIVKIL